MEPQDGRWGEIIVINFSPIVISGLALAPKTIGGEIVCQKYSGTIDLTFCMDRKCASCTPPISTILMEFYFFNLLYFVIDEMSTA